MPWFRIDDGFADHPKVVQCSLASIGLWTKAGAWCSKHLTDGKVPKGMLRTWGATPRLATELVVAGLWNVTTDGYEFHEWSGRNPTRAEVLEARKTDADRKRDERRATPRVRADSPNGVRPDAPRTPDGEMSDSDRTSHARARDPHPIPSRPDPIPTESGAPSVGEPVSVSLEAALRAERPTLGTASSAVAEAVEDHLVVLGLKRVDTLAPQVRADLVWIGAQPAADVVRVAATVLADEWCKSNFGLASSPGHLRRRWHVYVEGPKSAQPKRGMSDVSAREEHNEPDPEWMHDA